MYAAELGRFITRDPLPQKGVPDVLYDNNEFGEWLTLMRNLYGYVDSNPIRYTDSYGLDRSINFCGHAWIEVDEWDDCGNKIGTLRLDLAPNDWFLSGAEQYTVLSGESAPYYPLVQRRYVSTPEQDRALVEAWRVLEKARHEPGIENKVLNYTILPNNCWVPVLTLGSYGGPHGEAQNPPPPPPTEWYGSGTPLGSY